MKPVAAPFAFASGHRKEQRVKFCYHLTMADRYIGSGADREDLMLKSLEGLEKIGQSAWASLDRAGHWPRRCHSEGRGA